jgi:SAM-dependent methyltransferase
MIFGKRYFERVFRQEDPWRYFVCEYENKKYIRQIEAMKQYCPQPRSILEIGCAEGAHTLMLASAFPEASILGIDISHFAVERAKRNCQQCENVKIIEADVTEQLFRQVQWPESTFDVIVQSELLYYLFPKLCMHLSLAHYVKATTQILKNGGILVTSHQINMRTRPAMGAYYSMLKRVCRLLHNSLYREWHDIRHKYLIYDLKVFAKAR